MSLRVGGKEKARILCLLKKVRDEKENFHLFLKLSSNSHSISGQQHKSSLLNSWSYYNHLWLLGIPDLLTHSLRDRKRCWWGRRAPYGARWPGGRGAASQSPSAGRAVPTLVLGKVLAPSANPIGQKWPGWGHQWKQVKRIEEQNLELELC